MGHLVYAERGHVRARRFALVVSTALCTGFAAPAFAQDTAPALPSRMAIDENGVELTTGKFVASHVDLSIGPDEKGGLQYTRFFGGIRIGSNWDVRLSIPQNGTVIATLHGDSYKFTATGGGYDSADGKGAKLTGPVNSRYYTLTTSSGIKVVYDDSLVGYSTVNGVWTHEAESFARAISITYPDGYVESLTYASMDICTQNSSPCPQQYRVTGVRLQAVVNSNGYHLHFNYGNDVSYGYSPSYFGWSALTFIQAINNKVEYCSPTSVACSVVGNWPKVTYSGAGAISPGGRVFSYSNTGTTISISNEDGTTKTVSKPAGQNPYLNPVSSIVDRGSTWQYSYTTSGNIATLIRTDPKGATRTYVSDVAKGVVTLFTNELNKNTIYDYDTVGHLTGITYPEGNKYVFTYDTNGNQTASRLISKTPGTPADLVNSASYPCSSEATCDKPTWKRDANGNQTDYTYDNVTGNVLTVAEPAAAVGGVRPTTSYTYTTSNGVQLISDISTCQMTAWCVGTADEVKTTIGYNSNLLSNTVTRAAGNGSLTAITTIGYDDVGNVQTVDGPLAGTADTTTYRYDADRERVGAVGPDPDGVRKRAAQRIGYNAQGQPTLVEVGTVNGTSNTDWANFTSLQQVTSTYDANARKTQDVMTAAGTTYAVTQYGYDALGRVECTAQRMNSSVWGSQAANCTPDTSGSSGPDRIVRNVYDAVGRIKTVQNGYGTTVQTTETTSYTDNGQTASLTDANGNTTSYTYDGFDRLLKTSYPSTTKGSGISSTTDYEQLTYDANGNVTSRRLRDGGTVAFGIDNLNRVTSRTENGTLSRQYGYDLLGHLTSSSWSGGGSTETLTYDALGRLISRAEPYTKLEYQYDAAGRRTRVTWPDKLFISYTYDFANEMKTVVENDTTTLATYGYDDLGRRTSLTRGNGTASYYSYDGASRLTCLRLDLAGGGTLDCNPTASGQDNAIKFDYYSAGQIKSRVSANTAYAWTGNVNVNRPYTTNGLNQYTASGSVSLGYDGRGNLNTSGNTTFGYDALNHLVSTNGAASTLEYGSLDELQGYNLSSSSPRFASDGGNIIGEYLWGVSPSLQRRYVYGADTDEPLVWYEGTGTSDKRWLIPDERGSIVAVTNASGTSIATNTYDEYGIPGGSNQGRFQYTGQAWLPEVGLHYYKARMYSPTLGRFMQTDPIGYDDGMNWYNYGASDPINTSDSDGLDGTKLGYATNSINWHATANSPLIICGDGTAQFSCERHNPDIVVTGTRMVGGFGPSWGSWSGSMAQLEGVCLPGQESCRNSIGQYIWAALRDAFTFKKKQAEDTAHKCWNGRNNINGNEVAQKITKGLVQGAAKGFAKGAVRGASEGPEGAVALGGAGAVVGGAKGAVTNGVESAVKSACENGQ